jgi:2-methylcitrate dehydratase PrpD
MGITEQVADFIVNTTIQKMPSQAVKIAKDAILDCLGVMLAGAATDEGKIMTRFVRDVGGNPVSTVVGGGFRTSAPWAALANGTMGHAEDFDDSGFAILGHPSVPVLPAILALGEQCKASGKDVIEAYIVGFEVESKLGLAVIPSGHYGRGWHATATLGAMGAAAASAHMLKLDLNQTRMALGIAASQVSGVRQNFGTMTKPFHAGHAARNGVVAAMLAKLGFTAHADIIEEKLGFCNVFKGDNPCELGSIVSGLGETYEITTSGIAFKLFPSCHETHACIHTVLDLRLEHGIEPQDVESIDCVISELIATVAFYTEPKTGLEGKFSVEYCIARALYDGKVALEDFTDKSVNQPQVREIKKKIRRHLDPSQPGLSLIEMTIKMKDGREFYKRSDEILKGFPQRPLSREELTGKYRQCARILLSAEDVERSLALVESLENLRDISELTATVMNQTAS